MKKSLALLTVLVLALSLAGCGWFDSGQPSEDGITLVDDFDREVVLEQPAQRIISLVPANTEMVYALGIGDRMVGVSDFCNYPPEAEEVTAVGGFDVPNIELIASLEPDLVMAASLHKETVESLETAGVPVLALDPQSIEEIYANIRLIAQATGQEEAGEMVVEDMEQRLDQVEQALSGLEEEERPTVFYEVWYPGISTAGEDTFIDEMITLAGGKNLAWGISRWTDIQEEEVLARNPDIIVHGYPDGPPEDFAQREGWNVITAIQEDKIHFINPDITSRTGPRVVDAVEEMARAFHPDLFE